MEVQGKNGIRARVLKKSKSAITGVVFTTFEIEYPRIILAELNTHRMLPKNSASSRAIPFLKMREQLHGQPVRFGQANPGMQDKGEDFNARVNIERHMWGAFSAYLDYRHPYITLRDVLNGEPDDENTTLLVLAQDAWEFARFLTVEVSRGLYEAGYHKQVYNRLTESSQMMKTVISGTEWANFFWLRNHEAADPTLQELARVMHEADKGTDAFTLRAGEWHLPYVDFFRELDDTLVYGDFDNLTFTRYALEDAIKISCARCAAVSFRNEDYTLEKSKQVYDRLVGDERKHASAFEHCGSPMQPTYYGWPDMDVPAVNIPSCPSTWQDGISHMDRGHNLWSGPLKGFIQYRKLIPGENFTGEY